MRERRRHERVPFVRDVRLSVLPDGPELKVNTTDLSQGGVGIFSPRLVPRGSSVRLSFRLPDEHGVTREEVLDAQVVFGRVETEGNILGVQFVELLGPEDHPALWHALSVALKRHTRVGS